MGLIKVMMYHISQLWETYKFAKDRDDKILKEFCRIYKVPKEVAILIIQHVNPNFPTKLSTPLYNDTPLKKTQNDVEKQDNTEDDDMSKTNRFINEVYQNDITMRMKLLIQMKDFIIKSYSKHISKRNKKDKIISDFCDKFKGEDSEANTIIKIVDKYYIQSQSHQQSRIIGEEKVQDAKLKTVTTIKSKIDTKKSKDKKNTKNKRIPFKKKTRVIQSIDETDEIVVDDVTGVNQRKETEEYDPKI